MRTLFFFWVLTAVGFDVSGQSATRINDLVHTRLELRFDYLHSHVFGKEELTLQPHFCIDHGCVG